MNKPEYDKMIAELELEAEIFVSAMWTIRFTLKSVNPTDAEKLEQINTVVEGAFRRFEEEVNLDKFLS